jgi:hypothetical protein
LIEFLYEKTHPARGAFIFLGQVTRVAPLAARPGEQLSIVQVA